MNSLAATKGGIMDNLKNNEELEKVTGGDGSDNLIFGPDKCPRCGSTSIRVDRPDPLLTICRCNECGYEWDF